MAQNQKTLYTFNTATCAAAEANTPVLCSVAISAYEKHTKYRATAIAVRFEVLNTSRTVWFICSITKQTKRACDESVIPFRKATTIIISRFLQNHAYQNGRGYQVWEE